jgi:nitrogen fixation protein FixH
MLNSIRKSDRFIPYYFVLFFTVIAAVDGVFVWYAVTTMPGVVTDRAYEKGLAFDTTLEMAHDQKERFIQDKASFNQGELRWELYNSDGTSINHADITAHFMRPVQNGYDFDIKLNFIADGLYTVQPQFPLKGSWIVKLTATWNSQSYYRSLKFFNP